MGNLIGGRGYIFDNRERTFPVSGNFTSIKNISRLNEHAFQASHPRTLNLTAVRFDTWRFDCSWSRHRDCQLSLETGLEIAKAKIPMYDRQMGNLE